jgi:hypothetical protein
MRAREMEEAAKRKKMNFSKQKASKLPKEGGSPRPSANGRAASVSPAPDRKSGARRRSKESRSRERKSSKSPKPTRRKATVSSDASKEPHQAGTKKTKKTKKRKTSSKESSESVSCFLWLFMCLLATTSTNPSTLLIEPAERRRVLAEPFTVLHAQEAGGGWRRRWGSCRSARVARGPHGDRHRRHSLNLSHATTSVSNSIFGKSQVRGLKIAKSRKTVQKDPKRILLYGKKDPRGAQKGL